MSTEELQALSANVGPWFEVGGDSVQLLRDGAQAFPAMLEAIARAKKEILLEMYWIGADACGKRFRDALIERAKAGVAVHVIYDSLGSLGMTEAWWLPLRDAGGDVREYHAVFPFTTSFSLERMERRDHRKILVVDDEIAFIGGINLSVQWLPIEEGGEAWRDDLVAVKGPAVDELRSLFFEISSLSPDTAETAQDAIRGIAGFHDVGHGELVD